MEIVNIFKLKYTKLSFRFYITILPNVNIINETIALNRVEETFLLPQYGSLYKYVVHTQWYV